jgi:hypothetical protein
LVEALSTRVCEVTGQPGVRSTTRGGGVKTPSPATAVQVGFDAGERAQPHYAAAMAQVRKRPVRLVAAVATIPRRVRNSRSRSASTASRGSWLAFFVVYTVVVPSTRVAVDAEN